MPKLTVDGIELHDDSRTDPAGGKTRNRWHGRRKGLTVYVRDANSHEGFEAFATLHVTLPSGVRYDAELAPVAGTSPESTALLMGEALAALRSNLTP